MQFVKLKHASQQLQQLMFINILHGNFNVFAKHSLQGNGLTKSKLVCEIFNLNSFFWFAKKTKETMQLDF